MRNINSPKTKRVSVRVQLLLSILCVVSAQSAIGADDNNEKRSLQLLKSLVDINSHSSNLGGITQVREVLEREFKKLGFISHSYDVGAGHRVLSFEFGPRADTKKGGPAVAFIGHVDTVFPQAKVGEQNRGKAREEASKIYGPGIIDMKGGLVVMLEVLRDLSFEERRKIRVLLNDDEELASVHSKEKLKELVQGISFGLVFEPGLPGGAVVTSSIGGQWIKVTVRGKAAHAGLEHAKGLNACVELAHKLVAFHQLTNYSKKLTVNVGVIQGGTQPNVVCEEASVVLDIRYVDPADFKTVLAQVTAISEKSIQHNDVLDLSPSVKVETLANVPSLPSHFTAKLFGMLKEVGSEVQQSVEGVHVGYGTDANHLSETGMQLLVGLGPYGGGMHTAEEFLEKDSLRSRTILVRGLVKKILAASERNTKEVQK